ncbi:MAG TPA: MFS transporter [Dehalococcoidia bacterium]|nr:MFS transporter [Dehalococcoidia bacterium]
MIDDEAGPSLEETVSGGALLPDVDAEESSTRVRMFESLEDPSFRWFFAALTSQMASLNMQILVRGVLVFELTNSYSALGLVSLANAVPGIALSLAGGIVADRARQKKYVVQAGQLASALNAAAVAAAIFAGDLTFGLLMVTAVIQGTIQALMMPARQAMLREVAGLDRLNNAVALGSASSNSMRLLAPAAGGVLFTLVGPEWVYVLMMSFYLFAAATLYKVAPVNLDDQDEVLPKAQKDDSGSMADGLRYVMRNDALRVTLLVNLAFVVLSMPYLRLLPGYVTDVMHEGPDKLGYLLSLTGVGSLAGALWVATLPPKRRGQLYLIASLLQGIALIAFSASSWFWVSVPIMLVLGLGQVGRQSFGNVLVQQYTDDAYRGRVMSIYMLQFSLTSLGAFLVGLLASAIGAQEALGGTSIALVLCAIFCLAFIPRLRNLQ